MFEAINPPQVKFYSCGPTVYDYAHIGNFRAFLTYDILKRWLMYCGYSVEHICNITDVDDKIINKMKAENKSLKEITSTYTNAFFNDLETLNIMKANKYPKATEHINDIESMINQLIKKGHAYTENDSVYFRVDSFNDYGKLANIDFDEIKVGAGGSGPNKRRGIEEKESNRDFVLWKAVTPSDDNGIETQVSNQQDVTWMTSFGRGRPGWHIECSAMCHHYLGATIDLHAGGVDLVFPHHQNEIAQSEAFSGQLYSKYWIHNGFVNINNEKMSKSLKNFKTLRDIIKTPNDARAFRYFIVTAQYRNPLNFNEDALLAANSGIKRIDKLVFTLKQILKDKDINKDTNVSTNSTPPPTATVNPMLQQTVKQCQQDFLSAMCDDMNTPRATASLFKLINAAEKYSQLTDCLEHEKIPTVELLLSTINNFDMIFGILYEPVINTSNQAADGFDIYLTNLNESSNEMNKKLEKIHELAQKRITFKANKLYKEADSIRDEIQALGFTIKDSRDGGYDLLPI